MAGNSGEPGRTVTSKVAAILLALTTGRGHTLSALARQTGLAVSTVYRLLADLSATPVVERTRNGEYRPGPGLRGLACTAVTPTLVTRGPLAVDDLAAALQAPVRLGVLDEWEIAYIEKEPGPVPGTSFPNAARLPLHATALGKALLAFAPASVLHIVAAVGLARYTPRTLTQVDDLRRALLQTRLHGVATSDRELGPRLCAVAVPVFADSGEAIAALEVRVPDLSAATLRLVTPALVVAARALGRELAPHGSAERSAGDA